MESSIKKLLPQCYSVVVYLLTWSSLGNPTPTASTPFPSCPNVTTVTCARRCLEVPITISSDYSNGYSSDNTLCIDSSSLDTYRLHGCPQSGFYDPLQETRGACITSDDNGTDLYLTANKLQHGHHQFKCYINNPQNGITISTIVGNDALLYRDIQFYINGVPQGSRDNTGVILDVGDNFTVTVIAVGNVSVINASDPRFICVTEFACNNQTRRNLKNHYMECSLSTPVVLSDDGRTLTVIIDNTEVITIGIMVNDGPALLSPSISTPTPTTASADGQSTAIVDPVITSTSTDHSTVNIAPTAILTTVNTMSASSSSIDQTPSSTSEGIPTSPSSDEASENVAGHVITAIVAISVVIIVVIIVVVLFVVAYCIYKRRSRVRKKNTVRHSEEASVAVPTPTTCHTASSSRRTSIEADRQQQYVLHENFKELNNKIDQIGNKVDHIDRKVDCVDDKVEHNAEITEQCKTSVSTLMVNGLKDKTTHSDSADCHDFLDVKFE